MTDNKKYIILKTLTSKELKEICKQHELRGFSGLKQKELAKFASDNLDIPVEEIESLANSWLYQIKKGKYPFCKHYPAVIAELIYRGDIDPKVKPNYIPGRVYDALLEIVEERRREEGLTQIGGRNIEQTLEDLKADFLKRTQ